MGGNGKILGNTIDSMFAKNNESVKCEGAPKNRPQLPKVNKRDLEVAAAVLLVDLASCDKGFDQREYHMISIALKTVFGTPKDHIQGLVNQANVVLKNLRGTGYYSKLLKDNLESEAKRAFMECIEEIIGADGTQDGFEIYLRQRIADSLGVELVEQ